MINNQENLFSLNYKSSIQSICSNVFEPTDYENKKEIFDSSDFNLPNLNSYDLNSSDFNYQGYIKTEPFEENQDWNIKSDFCLNKTNLENSDSMKDSIIENSQNNYPNNYLHNNSSKIEDDKFRLKSCLKPSSYLSSLNTEGYLTSNFSQCNQLAFNYTIQNQFTINLSDSQQNSENYIPKYNANFFQNNHNLVSFEEINNQSYDENFLENFNSTFKPFTYSETYLVNNIYQNSVNYFQPKKVKKVKSENKRLNQQKSLNKNHFGQMNNDEKKFKKLITLNENTNVNLDKIKLTKRDGSRIFYLKCSFCDYKTNTTQSIKDHLFCIHCKIKDNYQCKICDQKFGWKNNAQRHMRRVHYKEDKNTKRDSIIIIKQDTNIKLDLS